MSTTKENNPLMPWFIFIGLAPIWGSSFYSYETRFQSFTFLHSGRYATSKYCRNLHDGHWVPTFSILFKEKIFVPLLIVGFLGNAIPYVLFPLAVNHLDSGVVGIINSLVPLFTVLIGGWFFGQKAGKTGWQGVAVGP